MGPRCDNATSAVVNSRTRCWAADATIVVTAADAGDDDADDDDQSPNVMARVIMLKIH